MDFASFHTSIPENSMSDCQFWCLFLGGSTVIVTVAEKCLGVFKNWAAQLKISFCVSKPLYSFRHDNGSCMNKMRKTKPRLIALRRICKLLVSIFSFIAILWLRQRIISIALGGVFGAVAEVVIWSRFWKKNPLKSLAQDPRHRTCLLTYMLLISTGSLCLFAQFHWKSVQDWGHFPVWISFFVR